MRIKAALSEAEAQEMIARLEEFYKQPVLPLHRFCAAIELWMKCIEKRNHEPGEEGLPEEHRSHPYFKHLRQMNIDIRKSNLLGRLLYAKQKFRTRVCPLHKRHWSEHAMFVNPCPHLCDGTGGWALRWWIINSGEQSRVR